MKLTELLRLKLLRIDYKTLIKNNKSAKIHPRTNQIIIVDNYNRNGLKGRVDNMNVVTEGINTSTSPSSSYPKIRVPSKKHKNRYKNFLKLFPDHEKQINF